MIRTAALTLLLLVPTITAFAQSARQAVTASPSRTEVMRKMDELSTGLAALERSHAKIVELTEKMSAMYVALGKKIEEVGKLAAASSNAQAQLLQATKQLQEMQASFNLQYPQLQQAMQHENRQFTMLSNVMKTKHDTAKNAIQNIR